VTRISSAIFSIYIAALLYTTVPFVKTLTIAGNPSADGAPALFWNHLAIFAIFFLLAFFVLQRHISSFGGGLQIFLGTVALLGLILTVFYHIIPIAPVYELPKVLAPYFSTNTAFTAWLIAPLVVLFF
jgi:hypothetical protein